MPKHMRQDGKNVLRAHQAAVKERETRQRHEQHERGDVIIQAL